jgi:predicted nucleic acid-binding protein
MRLVVDANLVAALVLPLPYSDLATNRIRAWKHAGIELLAPLLLEYEITAVLRKATVAGWLNPVVAVEAMGAILSLHIQCEPPSPEMHEAALRWAKRLHQTKTCDAYYLALAEREQSELWTADRRLVNGARQAGFALAYWIGQDGKG